MTSGRPLGAQAARSGGVSIAANAAQLATGVAGTAVLARLLTPADFGLYFMTAAVVDLGAVVAGFGFATATMTAQDPSPAQLAALYRLNRRLGAAVLAALVAVAPLAALFFGEARIIGPTVVVSAGLFLYGLAAIHLGLLQRHFRFAVIAVVEVASFATGTALAVGAAAAGAGYWALALQQLVIFVTRSLAYRWASPWRPSAPADGEPDIAGLRRFSRDLTTARTLAQVGRDADRFVVGRVFGSSPLGLYQNAYRWSVLPLQQLYTPLLNVIVATLSRTQSAAARYRSAFRRILGATVSVAAPAIGCLAVTAGPAIRLLLGPQWDDAVPLFQILLAAAATNSLLAATKWLYYTEGRTDEQLRWTLLYTPVSVAGVVLGAAWSVTGVAVGFAVTSVIELAPGLWFCLRRSPVNGRDVARAAGRPALAAVTAAAAVLAAHQGPVPADTGVVVLVASVVLYLGVYAAVWTALPGGRRDLADAFGLARTALGHDAARRRPPPVETARGGR